MRISKSFMTLVSVVVLSSVLSAANGNPSSFMDFDKNGDGYISSTEFDDRKTANMTKRANEGKQLKNAGNSPQFADLDTNKDGKINNSEYAVGKQLHMKKQQKMRKQNKNRGKGKGKNSN